MDTMAISAFKATCLAALERVRKTGRPLLVTRRGKPIAQILPPPAEANGVSAYGAMVGRGEIVGDIVGPTTSPEDWDAYRA